MRKRLLDHLVDDELAKVCEMEWIQLQMRRQENNCAAREKYRERMTANKVGPWFLKRGIPVCSKLDNGPILLAPDHTLMSASPIFKINLKVHPSHPSHALHGICDDTCRHGRLILAEIILRSSLLTLPLTHLVTSQGDLSDQTEPSSEAQVSPLQQESAPSTAAPNHEAR